MEKSVGHGFRPTDEELVGHYLHDKIKGEPWVVNGDIGEVDIYRYDPWNLRFESKYKSGDLMWYFFSLRDNKYGNGNRNSRTTKSGRWKLTGKPVDVKDQWGTWCGTPGTKIGHKRVLVFLDGINSKSDWVIHEFHYESPHEHEPPPEHENTYVICRLEYKGSDINIAKATDPTNDSDIIRNYLIQEIYDDRRTHFDNPTPSFVPNMTMVNQSLQGNSGSHNTNAEYDPVNQGHQFNEIVNMHQPVQGNLGSFNHSPVFESANYVQQFDGNFNMHQPVQGGYSEPFNLLSEVDPPNYGTQQSILYSDQSNP